jgi:mannose-6-phosphate isomerase-like protein (cupin superfamily)
VQVSNLDGAEPFVTKDGSTIREVAHPAWTAAANQSLAEATVPPGGATDEHYHPRSEEIYFFTGGHGRMRLGAEESEVRAGDCVVIPPGTPHKLWNPTDQPLVLLCACAPAYSHEDTVLTGG